MNKVAGSADEAVADIREGSTVMLGGFGMRETARTFLLVAVASAVLALVAWGIWHGLDAELGRSFPAQIVSLGAGLVLGYAAFFGMCRLLGVRELETMLRLRRSRA